MLPDADGYAPPTLERKEWRRAGEHQKMREWLKVPLEGGNIEENLPFASDPETLGEPTFEGGDGRKFWFQT
jgi:hypothetical protein